MAKWDLLSVDLKICYRIFEADKITKEKIWLGKLVKLLKKDSSRATISKTVDRLFDLGIIDGQWQKVDGKWTRTLKITGEAEDLIRSVYKTTKIPRQ